MRALINSCIYRLRTPPPEHWRKELMKLLWLPLFPIALLLKDLAASDTATVERVYSRGIYPVVSQAVSFLFGWMPFSAAEFILFAGILVLFLYIAVQTVLLFARPERLLRAFKSLVHLSMVISIGYFLFITLWGLNYYRQPLAVTMGYQVAPRSVHDLKALCVDLVKLTNGLRAGLPEDDHGALMLPEGKLEILKNAPQAFEALSRQYPLFSAQYGPPKPVLFSRQMSYTDTQGVFFPFTIEPNVNTDIPDVSIASTACHEVAHQYGFAREDEANFIGWLACMASNDRQMMYSGALMALTTSMHALSVYDFDAYWEIYETYSDGVKRDRNAQSKYWKQFEGPVAEASTKMNNAYLMSNKQADGVNSYGRMVDLLLAQMQAETGGQIE